MSATSGVVRLTTAAPRRSLAPTLALQEARRLLLHPLMLFGFAVFVVVAVWNLVTDPGPRDAFETVASLASYYPGIFTILAANLVTTRDRRAGGAELLEPVPARHQERVTALVLASLAPALLALALVSALHAGQLLDGRYFEAPGPAHALQAAVTVLGGCLLGILIGVWLPYRPAAVVGMVAMVVLNAWLSSQPDGMYLGPMMNWAYWTPGPEWIGTYPGSPAWHVVYLLGLCGLAASAALVRVADRRVPVVLAGLASLVVTVAAGWVQLP